MRSGKMVIHEFVIMTDHVHILMTVPGGVSVERAMQLIKGGFSFRAKKELGFSGEIWQRGYSDVRILDDRSFQEHREYIEKNAVKAGLVGIPEEYPFGTAYLKKRKQGLNRLRKNVLCWVRIIPTGVFGIPNLLQPFR